MANKILDKQSILLLAVQAMFVTATALSGTFIPVYLWKSSESYMVIGFFTLLQYICGGFTFWIAGKWVKQKNKMNVLRLGMALCGVFYCVVLWLGDQAVHYIFVLGTLQGIALGFFWLAFNVIYFEITSPENRDRYNGWAGLLGSGAGIIAPWLSGFLITTLKGEAGYRFIFTVSLIIFIAGAILSFWLEKRPPKGVYNWTHGWQQLKQKGNDWRRLFPAIAAQGVREGVFMFLVGLTVYTATSDESKVGFYALVTSFVAFISFWAAGRWMKEKYRSTAMFIGAVMTTVVIIPLFWELSFNRLLIFGIGVSLFMPLYSIPMTSKVFDMIGQNEKSVQEREEYVVLREAALMIGRVTGLAAYFLVMAINDSATAITWLLFAVGAVPIISWWIMRYFFKYKKV